MAKAKTAKQIAVKIRSLKKQVTKLEKQKKRASTRTRKKTTSRRRR